jgi:hypothetical protein
MTSLFRERFESIAKPRFRQRLGGPVTIHRGPRSTSSVTAVWSRPAAETIEGDGLQTEYEGREWAIAKAAYLFSAVAAEPRAGDRIVDADGTWQVLPDDGKPAVRSDGDDWVIATKKVNLG